MFQRILLLVSIVIFVDATCQNYVRMNSSDQKIINENLTGKRFFLKSSMYYGDFYGNSDICLLSPRKFKETNYLEGLDKKTIFPGEEKGIVPYNSEVLVEKVEFPFSNRPLLTPRFYPWVYLKVDKLSGYKSCIVVIRPDVGRVEEFKILFYEIFSAENNEKVISKFNSDVRDAIFNKKYIDGLSEQEVYIIFGKPDRIEHKRVGDTHIVVFDYEYFTITFKDDRTVSFNKVEKR